MGPVKALPRERTFVAIAVFLLLVFPLSWYPWILSLIAHRGNGGPNPLGVLVAGLVASTVWRGWRGARDLLLGIVKVRAPLITWVVALLSSFAFLALALGVAKAIGIVVRWAPPSSDLADRFVFTLLFVALGEEPGWRGFLLPALQRSLHPLIATLVVALVWAPWHLPLLGTEFAWPIVPAFLASLLGGAILLSWIYNASGGSVLLPMLLHAMLNTVGAGYAFHLVGAADQPRFWTIYAAVWIAAGVVTIILSRGQLGRRKAAPSEAAPALA